MKHILIHKFQTMVFAFVNNSFYNNIARNIFQTENIAPVFSSHTKFINNTATTILIVTTYLVLDNHNLFLFEENECRMQ